MVIADLTIWLNIYLVRSELCPYIWAINEQQRAMNNVTNLRKIEATINDKSAVVHYANHGYTVTFDFASTRKTEIVEKANALRSLFPSVAVKGRKFFEIHVITITE